MLITFAHAPAYRIMHTEEKKTIADFWISGINYRKSDATLRGRYAINNEQYLQLLAAAPSFGIQELFVLSTCNRTEIYGFTKDPAVLDTLLCSFTEGGEQQFQQQAYRKSGHDALQHIFNVAAGLDSQILGDYEIVGQIKQSLHYARENGRCGQFMERLYQTVLQSSRAVRSETHLSSGTVSVAFAAVQFLKNKIKDRETPRVLIIGSGKIGQNTCKNLMAQVDSSRVTLINRTEEKARSLAEALGVAWAPYARLPQQIKQADVIIVATNAPQPVLTKADLEPLASKILIDLSIPHNIHPEVKEYPYICLANVDDLSKISDETLRRRKAEVPKAEGLIHYYIHEFLKWCQMRQYVPVIKALKETLSALNLQMFPATSDYDPTAVQRTLNTMALKMSKEERKPGCNYIEALNGYLSETIN